jgi:predicted GIY-YIG superfamily endonuclease
MDFDRRYYVYIMASHSRVLYIGSTSDLRRRLYQHKHGLIKGFVRLVESVNAGWEDLAAGWFLPDPSLRSG